MQVTVNLAGVQSNIVIFQVEPPANSAAVLAGLEARGVLAIAFMGGVRMVTHNDLSEADCREAIKVLAEVLASPDATQHANGHHETAPGPYAT